MISSAMTSICGKGAEQKSTVSDDALHALVDATFRAIRASSR